MTNTYKDSWEYTCASDGYCIKCGTYPKDGKRYGKPVGINTIMIDVIKSIEKMMQEQDENPL